MFRTLAFFCTILLFMTTRAYCLYGNYIDSLKTVPQKKMLDSVAGNFHIDQCCNSDMATCLTAKSACTIAPRLYNFTAWLVSRMKPYDTMTTQLQKRYRSFFGPDTYRIKESYLKPAGAGDAPITVTVYMTTSCSVCKAVTIPLYLAVTQGPLKGMAKLQIKPISQQIDDFGLLAAEKMGKFWEFYLSLEKEKKRMDFSPLVEKAAALGLDKDTFKALLEADTFKLVIKEYRLEAAINQVFIAPTIFIDNRRYESYKSPQWIVDVVEYQYEQMTHKKPEKK